MIVFSMLLKDFRYWPPLGSRLVSLRLLIRYQSHALTGFWRVRRRQGLQGCQEMRSRLRLNKAVFKPRRAVVMAASHPAWPPPTTITSKDSVGALEKLMSSLSVCSGSAVRDWLSSHLFYFLLLKWQGAFTHDLIDTVSVEFSTVH